MKPIKIAGRSVVPNAFTAAEVLEYTALYDEVGRQRTAEMFAKMLNVVASLVLKSLKRADESVTLDEVLALTPNELLEAIAAIGVATMSVKMPQPPSPMIN
jgi:hypothetical protein